MPAYAVDRTEVVLKSLADLLEQGSIPQLPIFVDSPMSVAALEVYRDPKNADELRPDLGAGFLELPGLRAVRTTAESIKLNGAHGPRIIISASGMATGGRVLHHLEHLLPDPRNTVVLVGYQAVGTRGRQLLEGARQLKLHGRYVPVRAEVVQEDEFSVHADGDEVLAWLRELSPAPDVVYVVHGEPDSARALADRIDKELGLTAVTPRRGEVVRLNH